MSEKIMELQAQIESLERRIADIGEVVNENNRTLQELIWAQVFENARPAYSWLEKETAFWPGRFGVGYQYMYVVSRILNDVQPTSILETGLGQSTRLIASYAKWKAEKETCTHLVFEHDKAWIDTFYREFPVSSATRICQSDLAGAQLGNYEKPIYVYQDFAQMIENRKFDFISLDGPYGTDDVNGYSRVDILEILPQCLEEQFCIVLDDFNRAGEKNTVNVIRNILRECGISYWEKVYRGNKDLYLLVSRDWKFLCSL